MTLVVFLRGVNVGGWRRLRPATLATQLRHLGAVNIGAAGTLVVRRPIGRAELRAEIARRLPFEADIVLCTGQDILRIARRDAFVARRVRPDVVRFVSVLSRAPRATPTLPLRLPATGPWMVRVLAREGRFVFGVHRRHMRAIGCLGALDRIFGVRATTRSASTIAAIARVLAAGAGK
jgi:uncharacterized protein (DUF1697 family)